MIVVHRLTHPESPLYINPDQIQLVEANPDTVVTLINGSRFVVGESPAEIAALVRTWRASIVSEASTPHLRAVKS